MRSVDGRDRGWPDHRQLTQPANVRQLATSQTSNCVMQDAKWPRDSFTQLADSSPALGVVFQELARQKSVAEIRRSDCCRDGEWITVGGSQPAVASILGEGGAHGSGLDLAPKFRDQLAVPLRFPVHGVLQTLD
jgi:hypothetical protein